MILLPLTELWMCRQPRLLCSKCSLKGSSYLRTKPIEKANFQWKSWYLDLLFLISSWEMSDAWMNESFFCSLTSTSLLLYYTEIRIWVWNNTRVSKWWENIHFWMSLFFKQYYGNDVDDSWRNGQKIAVVKESWDGDFSGLQVSWEGHFPLFYEPWRRNLAELFSPSLSQ